jgi:hypothetical protein
MDGSNCIIIVPDGPTFTCCTTDSDESDARGRDAFRPLYAKAIDESIHVIEGMTE